MAYRGGGGIERGTDDSTVLRLIKQASRRTWFSDASYAAIGGLCLEMEVFWSYPLPEEMQTRAVKSRQGVAINVSGLMVIVMRMILMRGDSPVREGENIGAKAVMKMIGALEEKVSYSWAFCCAAKKDKEEKVVRKLVAVNLLHGQ